MEAEPHRQRKVEGDREASSGKICRGELSPTEYDACAIHRGLHCVVGVAESWAATRIDPLDGGRLQPRAPPWRCLVEAQGIIVKQNVVA